MKLANKPFISSTDRYGRGIRNNGCKGQCEGTGFVPILKDEKSRKWRKLWLEAENKKPADDGWHFVPCPDCNR